MAKCDKQRVRTMQLVLMMVGGILIVFGILRSTFEPSYQKGLDAFWDGDLTKAHDLLAAQVEKEPSQIEPRIALMLVYLGLGELDHAEGEWSYLLGAPDESRSSASRLVEWRNQNIRDYYRIEGEVLYAQAWLTGERLLRSLRRNDPGKEIDIHQSSYNDSMLKFRRFIEPKATVNRKAQENPDPGKWSERYIALDNRIENGQRIEDRLAALHLMDSSPHNPEEETTETLHAMLEPHLNRAIHELPDDMRVHGWRLLVLAALTKRDAPLSDGSPALPALEQAILDADQFQQDANLGRDAADMARFYFSFAQALNVVLALKPSEKLSQHVQKTFYAGYDWLVKVDPQHHNREELHALRQRLESELVPLAPQPE